MRVTYFNTLIALPFCSSFSLKEVCIATEQLQRRLLWFCLYVYLLDIVPKLIVRDINGVRGVH